MLTSSPVAKAIKQDELSPFASPYERGTCKTEALGSTNRAFGYSPKSPMAFLIERVDVRASNSIERGEASLGKRNLSSLSQISADKKENVASPSSLHKSRQQKLKELDERYKLMSQKLSGGKFQTPPMSNKILPKPETQNEDVDAQIFNSESKVERVLTFQDPNITKTPERSPEKEIKLTASEVINIDIDEPVFTDSTVPQFIPDPETKLAYRAYAARTNNGIFRNYNEDRVSIIQKIYVDNLQQHPTSFFGLFDGHSGAKCVDFLRDNMHQLLTKQKAYRSDKRLALQLAFAESERKFLETAKQTGDNSGSCALVCLLEKEKVIVANVGDSRVVVSMHRGKSAHQITNDHKPEADDEKKRIFQNGGHIFRSKKTALREIVDASGNTTEVMEEIRYGPFRVEPGGLSVSRTIGDWQAKDSSRRGNPKCIIAEPEIFDIDLTVDHDLMVLACDGVFDVLTTKEVVDAAWMIINHNARLKGIKEACRLAAEYIMKLSFDKKSMDNITVIVIAFQPEQYYYTC